MITIRIFNDPLRLPAFKPQYPESFGEIDVLLLKLFRIRREGISGNKMKTPQSFRANSYLRLASAANESSMYKSGIDAKSMKRLFVAASILQSLFFRFLSAEFQWKHLQIVKIIGSPPFSLHSQ